MSQLTLKGYRSRSAFDSGYNRPNNFKEEGKDHLNISIQSFFPIGRILDPGYCASFEYPHLGRFKSILTLTYWLKSTVKDDSVRMLKGYKLKKFIKENRLHGKQLTNYYAIVAKATWIRVSGRKDIVDKIRELPDDLELLSYHTDKVSGVRITTNYAKSAVMIGEEIIKAIKEDRVPDFDKFVTEPTLTGNSYLEGVLKL